MELVVVPQGDEPRRGGSRGGVSALPWLAGRCELRLRPPPDVHGPGLFARARVVPG